MRTNRLGARQAADSAALGDMQAEAEGDTEDMNRERAETHLRLLAEEELRRATTQPSDGIPGSQPEDEAVRSASVTGTLAGSAAVPDAFMASRRGRSADRAVTELYSMHYRALVRLAALLLRDVRTAEEVVQDSFVAMHGGWQRLRDAEDARSGPGRRPEGHRSARACPSSMPARTSAWRRPEGDHAGGTGQAGRKLGTRSCHGFRRS